MAENPLYAIRTPYEVDVGYIFKVSFFILHSVFMAVFLQINYTVNRLISDLNPKEICTVMCILYIYIYFFFYAHAKNIAR